MANKNSLIDSINDAFVSVIKDKSAKGYENYIKSINRELIDNVDSLTPTKVRSIINNQKINIDSVILLFIIQNAIILLLNNPRMSKKDKQPLLPIIALMGVYSIKRPKQFVEKVVEITNGRGLNTTQQKNKVFIDTFTAQNKEVIIKSRKVAIDELKIAQKKSKISKNMIKDFKVMREDNKTIASSKKSLIRKYNSKTNVERVLDTELHAQSEAIRREHSIALGFTHKKWNNQGDERVRHTRFHDGVDGKTVPIDSDFRVAGMKAEQPGDMRLPPGERIRCRCFLTYN